MRTWLFIPCITVLSLASLRCSGGNGSSDDGKDGGATTVGPDGGGGGSHDAGHPATGTDSGSMAASDAGNAPGTDAGGAPGDGGHVTSSGKESWVWVYEDYASTMTSIAANKASFTHVSPAFYSINYAYTGGVAYYANCPTNGSDYDCTANGTNSFDGLTVQQFTAKATAAGLSTVANIYAGAGNGGSDTGVQNILDDVGGAGDAFITAMTAEAVTNGYGGYALDWEVAQGAPIGASYAPKLVAFVNKFEAALASHGMVLGLAAIVSNINGTWCSGNSGFLDLPTLATSSIDRIFIEDYVSDLGTATTSCQSVVLSSASPASCDYTLTGMMNMMCAPNLPVAKAVIALDADPGSTNPIAGAAFSAIQSYGFTRVAVWPQSPFMNTSGIAPASDTWYGLLQTFLTQ